MLLPNHCRPHGGEALRILDQLNAVIEIHHSRESSAAHGKYNVSASCMCLEMLLKWALLLFSYWIVQHVQFQIINVGLNLWLLAEHHCLHIKYLWRSSCTKVCWILQPGVHPTWLQTPRHTVWRMDYNSLRKLCQWLPPGNHSALSKPLIDINFLLLFLYLM